MKKTNIVIYMNCCGEVIGNMFDKKFYDIVYLANYKKLVSDEKVIDYRLILQNADIFIYQPINNHKKNLEWYPKNLIKYLNTNCKKIRISYYRIYDIDKDYIDKCNRVKILDNKSDLKMYDFFVNNKIENMFIDKNHPSMLFFQELFFRLIKLI